jgi:cytoskeletal protein CcmA (bactofilin family)
MSGIDDHFDEMTGLLYLEGQLESERAREAAEHAKICEACRELLEALERESAWLREAITTDDEAVPARLIEAPGRSSAHWGWIAVLGLGAGGIYTVWSSILSPWMSQAQQAGFTQGNILTMLVFSGAFWKGWDAMRSLMEFLAVGTLGIVVMWLLRRQWRHFTPMALVMGGLVLALLAPTARGADVRRGTPSFTLAAGEEVKTDLIVAADRVRIDGDVDGDLIVFSNSVTVNGHVKGDILGFAGRLAVNSTVDGNVRAFAQSLTIDGKVGKNVTAWTGTSDTSERSTIGGTLTLFSGSSDLDGAVAGDLLALSGAMEINGKLGHDASIRADRLTIGPTAEIDGRTKYQGRTRPVIASGAKLASPPEVSLRRPGPDYTRVRYYWHQTLAWGASFILGLVVLLIAPVFFSDVVSGSKRAGPAIGLGVLFACATPIAAILACFTIVGIGLAACAMLLYVVAVYSTQVFVGSWLGEKLLGDGIGMGPAVGRLALGLAILRGLWMLPYIGVLVRLLVIVWGLGALALAIHKRARARVPEAVGTLTGA